MEHQAFPERPKHTACVAISDQVKCLMLTHQWIRLAEQHWILNPDYYIIQTLAIFTAIFQLIPWHLRTTKAVTFGNLADFGARKTAFWGVLF